MKATGIVRRIDELGRVVVPKEIRRTLLLYDDNLECKKQAAEALGISLSTLYSKMESK